MAEKKSDKGAPAPKAARPAPDASTAKAPQAPKPPETQANYFVPAGLALAVVGALAFWSRSSSAPPEPAPVQWPSEPRPAQGQGSTGGGGANLPAPEPAPPGSGDPVMAAHPEPTTPDPRAGRFSLAEATEGMPAGASLTAEIETNLGTFTCRLLPERAPNTVANFVGLARGRRDFWDPVTGAWVRRPYFDGTIFHRVIPGFMAQGGDILRNGRGGPGYEFADENTGRHDQAGMLCMANHGPNTNGSQFFILEEPKAHLDGSYSVFGECAPVELVRRITGVSRDPSDRPNQPVLIRHVRVRR
jgi:peptidyl-prolyl cis-trans isomerase A (cyclophilin A)